MHKPFKRGLAALLTAAMIMGQAPVSSFAEEDTTAEETQAEKETVKETAAETQAETVAETQPETQPQTVAETQPETVPETQPETAAETQAETQAETAAETQAETAAETTASTDGLIEDTNQAADTETSAATEAFSAETETAAATEAESETEKKTEEDEETESESETEEQTNTFTTKVGDLEVTVTLSGKEKLPKSSKLVVEEVTDESDYDEAQDALEEKLNKGHREISDAAYYTVSFETKKGKALTVKNDVTVTFTYKEEKSLSLKTWLEPSAAVYSFEKEETEKLCDAALNEDAEVTAFETKVEAGELFALVGVQNHVNTGDSVTAKQLSKALSGLATYTASEEYEEDEAEADALTEEAAELLADAAEYSKTLADAQDSDDTVVVNLYADEDGEVSTAGLKKVLDDDGKIDTSEKTVILNVISEDAEGTVTLPDYETTGSSEESAESLLINVTAADEDGNAEDFEGTVVTSGEVTGTILAAAAEVELTEDVTGAVYAAKVSGEGEIASAPIGEIKENAEEDETAEDESEAVSEAQTDAEEEEQADAAGSEMADDDTDGDTDDAGEQNEVSATVSIQAKLTDGNGLPGVTYQMMLGEDPDPAVANIQTDEAGEAKVVFSRVENGTLVSSANPEPVTVSLVHNSIPDGYRLVSASLPDVTVTVTTEGEEATTITDISAEPAVIELEYAEMQAPLTVSTVNTAGESLNATVTAAAEDGTSIDLSNLTASALKEAFGVDTAGNLNGQKIIITQTAPDGYVTEAAFSENVTDEKTITRELYISFDGDDETANLALYNDWADGYGVGDPVTDITFTDLKDNFEIQASAADTAGSALTAKSYTLDATGEKNTTGTFALTADALKTAFGVSSIADLIGKTLTITQEAPESYVADASTGNATSEKTLTIKQDDGGNLTVDDTAPAFTDYKNTVSITIKSVDESGKTLNDSKITYNITGADSKALDGNAAKTDGTYTITLTAAQRQALASAGTLTWHVENVSTSSYYLASTSPVNVTLTLDQGDVKASGSETTFTYGVPATTAILTAAVKDTADKNLTTASLTIRTSDGKEITGAADSSTGAASWTLTVDNLKTAFGVSTAAELSGKTLTVTQTAPTGYVAQEGGSKTAERTITVSVDAQGNLSLTDAEGNTVTALTFTDMYNKLSVAISSTEETSGSAITDTVLTYHISYPDADGNYVNLTRSGNTAFADGTYGITLTTAMRAALLAAGGSQTWKVSYVSAPGYELTSASEVTFKVSLVNGDVVVGDDQSTAKAAFTYKVPTATSGETIRVTKEIRVDGSVQTASSAMTFYVALFDAEGNPATKIHAITIAKNKTTAYTDFSAANGDALQAGTTYTIHEVQGANDFSIVSEKSGGTETADYYAEYSAATVTTGAADAESTAARRITVTNHYYKAIGSTSSSLYVRKVYYGTDGKRKKTTGTFYYKIYNTKTKKWLNSGKPLSITLKNASYATKKLTLKNTTSASLRVVETDSKGNVLKSGETYKINYKNQSVTISSTQKTIPTVSIYNTEIEQETETDFSLKATLTLTKKVTYKSQAVRVNAVYYIGIFDDAALTNLRLKKAMQFKNASEVSADLTINLHTLASREVTFYFAEVDSKGNVVKDGTSAGYNITLNKSSVTLNADNLKAEVIVTNDIIAGSKTASALTNASSGFAGDASAAAEAAAIASSSASESESNSGTNTTTGDSTPLVPLAIALFGSLAVVCILIVVLVQRRKRRNRHNSRKHSRKRD